MQCQGCWFQYHLISSGGMGDEELEDALLHPWVRRCTRGAVEETREDQEQKAPEQNGPQNSVKEDTEEVYHNV